MTKIRKYKCSYFLHHLRIFLDLLLPSAIDIRTPHSCSNVNFCLNLLTPVKHLYKLLLLNPLGHAATIQTLWSQLQTEDQIVSALANVPVTPCLSSHVTGYLPVHCLSQLINSRLPSCPPNLFTWLPQQLLDTQEPVHPVLCELISGSVNYLTSIKGETVN